MRRAAITLLIWSALIIAAVAYLIGYAIGTGTWPPFIGACIIVASVATIAFVILTDTTKEN